MEYNDYNYVDKGSITTTCTFVWIYEMTLLLPCYIKVSIFC